MERLFDKIEAIRKEPEHVRMRYVFLSVAVSMAFVVLLWIFSIYEGFQSAVTSPSTLPPGIDIPKSPKLDDFSTNIGAAKPIDGETFFQSERLRDTGNNANPGQ